MQALFTTINSALNAATTTFGVLEKIAITADNFASVAQIKSGTYLKEAEHDQVIAVEEFAFEREKRRAKLESKRADLKSGKVKEVKAIAAS
jgi:hypothetical protein